MSGDKCLPSTIRNGGSWGQADHKYTVLVSAPLLSEQHLKLPEHHNEAPLRPIRFSRDKKNFWGRATLYLGVRIAQRGTHEAEACRLAHSKEVSSHDRAPRMKHSHRLFIPRSFPGCWAGQKRWSCPVRSPCLQVPCESLAQFGG